MIKIKEFCDRCNEEIIDKDSWKMQFKRDVRISEHINWIKGFNFQKSKNEKDYLLCANCSKELDLFLKHNI